MVQRTYGFSKVFRPLAETMFGLPSTRGPVFADTCQQ